MAKRRNLSFMLGIILGILVGFVSAFLIMNRDSDIVASKEELAVADVTEVESALDSVKEEIEGEDVFKVVCLYCDVYYPTKWENNVLIEETLNVVQFSADFGEGKVITLFDVVAMEPSDDEESIEVHIVKYDLEFNEQWTDEEKQIVIEMQNDADCVVEYLEKEDITVIM